MSPPRRNTGGQAMTEYTVVLALTVVALVLAALEPSPLDALLDAIRQAYLAFSYAISMSV
jgi:Flp pilus assembly pilin Flp